MAQFQPRKETKAIFVHCAATKPSQNVGVREIRQWHKERGFLDIGYHFVIKRDGTLETGRDVDVVGAHVEGYNHNSVGVCLVGGIDDSGKFKANFTPIQMSVLKTLLSDLEGNYPGVAIRAHHDVAAKACPSFDLQRWLKTGELVTSDRG
ncbi:N-acetylmuramoyl-L-alanine amidase [Pectobacterium phage Jarilo]|uniref:Endolysin n=1 Tax=Pectobacterium phage Jarilo TaxID=2163634 RepID=A0A2S1GSX4_9CAUD|nr:amidase [Pectobacterium phage Jarilo]AWD92498.1 N-acetylmuramoyl-L-alanine amidase [Pectobacterium phage Jarilo]